MARNNAINAELNGKLTTNGDVTFSGSFPFVANLTGATNVTFPTSGTLATIAQISTWPPAPVSVTGASQTLAPNNYYIIESNVLSLLSLPAVAAKGSIIKLIGQGTGLFNVIQGVGQVIKHGILSTSTGVSGIFKSTQQYDCFEFYCTVANITWTVTMSQGNPDLS